MLCPKPLIPYRQSTGNWQHLGSWPYHTNRGSTLKGRQSWQSLSNPWVHGHSHNVSTVNADVAVNGGKIISNIHSQWTHYVISPCKNYHTSCCKNYCYFTLARMYFIRDFLHGEGKLRCPSSEGQGSAFPALLTVTKRNFECFKKSRWIQI